MRRYKLLFIALTVLVFAVGQANAALISTVGGVLAGGAPLDLSEGASQNSLIQGFNEDQGVTTTGLTPIDYDITDATLLLTGISGAGGAKTLGPGTYDSHIIHYDPPPPGRQSSEASFTFDGTIVALMVTANSPIATLYATDSIFNSTTTDWNSGDNPIGRRAENGDTFNFDGNTLNVTLFSTNASNVDQIRVLTLRNPTVPLPATVWLFGAGLAGLGAVRRRR